MQTKDMYSARFFGSKNEISKLETSMLSLQVYKKTTDKAYRYIIKRMINELFMSRGSIASLDDGENICVGFDEIDAEGYIYEIEKTFYELEHALPNMSMAILEHREIVCNTKLYSPYGECVLEEYWGFISNVNNFPEVEWIPEEWRKLKTEEEYDFAGMLLDVLRAFNYIPFRIEQKKKDQILKTIQKYVDEHAEEFSYLEPDGCNSYSDVYPIMEFNIQEARDGYENDEPIAQLAYDIIYSLVPQIKAIISRSK